VTVTLTLDELMQPISVIGTCDSCYLTEVEVTLGVGKWLCATCIAAAMKVNLWP